MRIETISIQNFRCFKDITVGFDDYTCFVGCNGSGKSTILNALNVFFRQYKDSQTDLSKLGIEDFHHRDTTKPIQITVTFTDLTEKAKEDLSDYVRQDKLTISSIAEYDSEKDIVLVKQCGERLGYEEFRDFFDKDKEGVAVAKLREIYRELRTKFKELPAVRTKADMISSLREYESSHPDKCILIRSEDQFYGISKGVNRLTPHIQWVFLAATKDATEEGQESKASALGLLLARTVRSRIDFSAQVESIQKDTQEKYQEILDENQAALDELSKLLEKKLRSWAHPEITAEIRWKQDPGKSVRVEEPWASVEIGERGFKGDLARFGHGLQRSYMLALLQELNLSSSDASIPTLIIGIEEPELYQHPPQARHLAETLIELSLNNAQVVVCSHSPLFIPRDKFEAVRVVREGGHPSASTVSQLSYCDLADRLNAVGSSAIRSEGIVAKLYPSLNPIISEMFFCKYLILTEGMEDVAYISTYLELTGLMETFRTLKCHIVPVGGKSEIIKPLVMANLLNIPVFVVCDADTNKEKECEVSRHKKENRSILSILGYEEEKAWPTETVRKTSLYMWKTNLTQSIREEMGEEWENYRNSACAKYGNPPNSTKNPLIIAQALELAWNAELKSQLLIDLTQDLIKCFNLTESHTS